MKHLNSQTGNKQISRQARDKDHPEERALDLSAFDEDQNLKVIVETPRNCRHKYDYDPETGMFECHSILPLGMVFPFDFGFVPSSLAEDGDPIDVLLFMDEPVFPGCLVRARLIGVLEGEQTEEDGKTIRNDRLMAVYHKSLTYGHLKTWHDIAPTMRHQIEHFFVSYNEVKGKRFAPIGWRGAKTAYELITKSLKAFEKRQRRKSA